MERTIPLKFKNSDGTIAILPDDARQFVGYDHDGQEIYEGDRLFWEREIRYTDGSTKRIIDFRGYNGEQARLLPCAFSEHLKTINKHLDDFIVEKNGEYSGKLLGKPEDVREYLMAEAERKRLSRKRKGRG